MPYAGRWGNAYRGSTRASSVREIRNWGFGQDQYDARVQKKEVGWKGPSTHPVVTQRWEALPDASLGVHVAYEEV